MTASTTPHLKLVVFTSKHCGTCQHFKKNVLPLFKKEMPDLVIEEVQATMEGEKVRNPQNEARADAHEVTGFPTFVFEVVGFPRGGGEVATLSALKKFVAEAREVLKVAAEGGA
jgi:thioredoxin-related protein